MEIALVSSEKNGLEAHAKIARTWNARIINWKGHGRKQPWLKLRYYPRIRPDV